MTKAEIADALKALLQQLSDGQVRVRASGLLVVNVGEFVVRAKVGCRPKTVDKTTFVYAAQKMAHVATRLRLADVNEWTKKCDAMRNSLRLRMLDRPSKGSNCVCVATNWAEAVRGMQRELCRQRRNHTTESSDVWARWAHNVAKNLWRKANRER